MPVFTIEGAQLGARRYGGHGNLRGAMPLGLGAFDRQSVGTLAVRFPGFAGQLGAAASSALVDDCIAGSKAIDQLKQVFLAAPESVRVTHVKAVGALMAEYTKLQAETTGGRAGVTTSTVLRMAARCDEYRTLGLHAQALSAQIAQAAGLPAPGVVIPPTLIEQTHAALARVHDAAKRVDTTLERQQRGEGLGTATKVILALSGIVSLGFAVHHWAGTRRKRGRR